MEWLSYSGLETVDRRQEGVGELKQASWRSRWDVGMRIERRDSDLHPIAER